MLQYRAPLVQLEENESTYDPPFSAEPSLAEHLATIIGFIRRQFVVILAVVPLTLGLAVAYLYATPPLFTAQARILIDPGKVQVSSQPIFGDNPVSMSLVDSQIEILKSDSFVLSIIKKLHLTQDGEFVGSSQGLIGNIFARLLHLSASVKPKTDSALEQRALAVFEKRLSVAALA